MQCSPRQRERRSASDIGDADTRARVAVGRAYLRATGDPADGSQARARASTQYLVNPPVAQPDRRATVRAWMQARARADAAMQAAGRERSR